MLQNFSEIKYIPTLSLRPAEMNALEELPEKDKDALLPLILLKPWVGAHHLTSAIERIKKSFGDRPYILDFDEIIEENSDRPVFKEINDLKNSQNGYENWINFLKQYEEIIPVIQIRDTSNLEKQIESLKELNRGLVFRFTEAFMSRSVNLIQDIRELILDQSILVIFDFGQKNKETLFRPDEARTYINNIFSLHNKSNFSVSASSFPMSFNNLERQEIFELKFFSEVRNLLDDNIPLIYGDHGSARAEKMTGGSGTPPPRIDYPLDNQWMFHRKIIESVDFEDTNNKESKAEINKKLKINAYSNLAQNLTHKEYWDTNLRLWGTQMIESTAKGEGNIIDSPAKATSVRINLHLHRQLAQKAPTIEILETDDDWQD